METKENRFNMQFLQHHTTLFTNTFSICSNMYFSPFFTGGLLMAYHFNDNVYTKSFTPREYQVSYSEMNCNMLL